MTVPIPAKYDANGMNFFINFLLSGFSIVNRIKNEQRCLNRFEVDTLRCLMIYILI